MMRAGGRLGGREKRDSGEEQSRTFSEVLAQHDERRAQNLPLSF